MIQHIQPQKSHWTTGLLQARKCTQTKRKPLSVLGWLKSQSSQCRPRSPLLRMLDNHISKFCLQLVVPVAIVVLLNRISLLVSLAVSTTQIVLYSVLLSYFANILFVYFGTSINLLSELLANRRLIL